MKTCKKCKSKVSKDDFKNLNVCNSCYSQMIEANKMVFLSSVNEYRVSDKYDGYIFGDNATAFNCRNGRTLKPKYKDGTCLIKLKGKNISFHRLLFELFKRELLKSEIVVFKNGIQGDMSVNNLIAIDKKLSFEDGYTKIERYVRMDKSKEYNTCDLSDDILKRIGVVRRNGTIYYCQLDEGWFYKN